MAVGSGTPYNLHTGNGVATTFGYTFTLLDAADLVVRVGGVVTTAYTVSGLGSPSGGAVTFSTAPANGAMVELLRVIGLTRLTDYQNNGDLLAPTLNADFDRLWMAVQGVNFDNAAAVRAPWPETIADLPDAASRANKLLGFNSSGEPVMAAPIDGTAAALADDLADSSVAGGGAGQIGYYPARNYVAATTGGALNDSRAQLMWWITSEAERAAIKAGTSTTDHTATIAGALALIGARELHIGDAGQWNISATLTLASRQGLAGKARIRAINGAQITGAMVKATSATGVTLRDIELDANAANNGANYGWWLSKGSRNRVEGVYVHDTAQAGGSIEEEDGTAVEGGLYLNCGRAVSVTGGGTTDDHGVMIYSTTATPVKNVTMRGVWVVSARRKGIAVYSATPGTVVGLVLDGNLCTGCGVTASAGGGIYIANAPGGIDQDSVTLTGNVCAGNYVNFDLNNFERGAGAANVSRSSVAQGVILNGLTDCTFSGWSDSDAAATGIRVAGCLRVTLTAPVVARPNRSAGGFGPGIELANSTHCTVTQVVVTDDSGPNMTHGVLESGTSDHNVIDVARATNATSANVTITGANTSLMSRSGRNLGIGKAVPLNTLHIGGGLTIDEQAITLANGANQNVALPANSGTLVSNAPTGVYSIGGLQGGHAGRELLLVNYTSFAMTLKHQDAGSTAANRFTLAGSADRVVPALGAVRLVYSTLGGGAWYAVG